MMLENINNADMRKNKDPFEKFTAFIIDTETTGFDKPVRPCEVSFIELFSPETLRNATKNLSVLEILEQIDEFFKEAFTKRYNPERLISPGASKVNGIYDSEVINKPSYTEIYKDIPQEGYFIAHHAVYDWSVLFPSEDPEIPYKLPSETTYKPICTKQLAKIAFGYLEPPSFSLMSITENLLKYLKVPTEILDTFTGHTALGDVKRTFLLLILSLGRPEFKFQFLKNKNSWEDLYKLCSLGEAYERNAAKSPVLPEGEYAGQNLLKIPKEYRLEIYKKNPEWMTETLRIALAKSLGFTTNPSPKPKPNPSKSPKS